MEAGTPKSMFQHFPEPAQNYVDIFSTEFLCSPEKIERKYTAAQEKLIYALFTVPLNKAIIYRNPQSR